MITGNAQINDQNKLMKKDTMEQDNTRLKKEKNIRDTSKYNPVGDTANATRSNRSKKRIREDSAMYLVLTSGKTSRK